MAEQILEPKSDLRREMIARRDALPPDARSAAAEAIAARPFPLSIVAGTIVSGFMPMKSEINPLPLMKKLADAGAQLALPVTPRRGQPSRRCSTCRWLSGALACPRRHREPAAPRTRTSAAQHTGRRVTCPCVPG